MKLPTSIITLTLTCFLLFPVSCFASLDQAIDAMRANDYQTAIEGFIPYATKGDDKAMLSLGFMYHVGNENFKKNPEKAYYWYLKATEKENPTAFNNIGVLYRDGIFVKRDLSMAWALFSYVYNITNPGDDHYRAKDNLEKLNLIVTGNQVEHGKELITNGINYDSLSKYTCYTNGSNEIDYNKTFPTSLFPKKQSTYPNTKPYTLNKALTILELREDKFDQEPGFTGHSNNSIPLPNSSIIEGQYVSEKGQFSVKIPPLSTGKISIHQSG